MSLHKFVVPVITKTIVEVELLIEGSSAKEAMAKINNGLISTNEIREALERAERQYKNPSLKSIFSNALTIGEGFEVGEVTDEDYFGIQK